MNVTRWLKDCWQNWSEFWFDPREVYTVAAFRCLFSVVLFVTYCLRFIDFDLYFSSSGLMTPELARSYMSETTDPLFFWFPESDLMLKVLYVGFLMLLALLALGIIGRSMTWLIFLIHLTFLQRNFSVIYGADSVATFWLFYLSFCDHNKYFNVLKFWREGGNEGEDVTTYQSDILTSMGIRLIQIQLCLIYAYTGMEKLRGDQWWDGSALWYVLGNSQLAPIDLSFLVNVPWLVAIMTFVTLIFEIYFPFAVLSSWTRSLWLSAGVAMHLGVAFFMGLPFFSLIMLSSYLLFLTPRCYEYIAEPDHQSVTA